MKNSAPYARMAPYYDAIYHALVDYEAECDFLERLFRKHSKRKVRSILDAGCGTGNHSIILATRGYDVEGIDTSKPMLQIARGKVAKNSHNPSFERMDMRKITLKRRFDAALILFGAFTYLLKDSDVENCLSSISNHLETKGLLIFEFWHSSGILPASATPDGHRFWDRIQDKRTRRLIVRLSTSRYDPQTNLLSITFDHYVIGSRERELVEQFQEMHRTRTYNVTEIRRLLGNSGLHPLAFYAKGVEDPPKPPTLSTGRVICVAANP